ncbi:hypothetical protein RZS08_62960, partial [Arthrospira platensis SPKY1]|nr:hypothetical protein [Arthrospira platensis SPKY1]
RVQAGELGGAAGDRGDGRRHGHRARGGGVDGVEVGSAGAAAVHGDGFVAQAVDLARIGARGGVKFGELARRAGQLRHRGGDGDGAAGGGIDGVEVGGAGGAAA